MKKTWKDVVLPRYMGHLQKDHRGYPVPYVVARLKDGTPRFQINDEIRVLNALRNNKCAICGNKMKGTDKWLVGGPQSAFHPQGAYIDTPTHYECLRYALQVCPYLAYSSYSKRIDVANVDMSQLPDHIALLKDSTQSDERVPFFVAVQVSGIRIHQPTPTNRYIIPIKPYLKVEYWNDGKELTATEAMELLKKKK